MTQSGELISDDCNSARMKSKIDRAVTSLNDETYMIDKIFDTYRDSLIRDNCDDMLYERKLRDAGGYLKNQKEDHVLDSID